MKKNTTPIIMIGMHRSGTTMVARMLQELGLFIGWSLEDNYEARFFGEINETVLRACNGSWDNPMVVDNMLNNSGVYKKVVDTTRNDLNSLRSFYFLGPKYFLKYRSPQKFGSPWGWKDPRNIFLLPLWLDIFPEAKIIHIYRNGIDVAQSLAHRESEHVLRLANDIDRKSTISNQKKQIKDSSLLVYMIIKAQAAYRKLNPLEKYYKLGVKPCISIESGFELWCIYIKRAFDYLQKIENQTLTIRYEDFLCEPEHHLRTLNEFCGLASDEQKIKSIASEVRPHRRYAFKDSESLMNFYNTVKDNYWMKKLYYGLEN